MVGSGLGGKLLLLLLSLSPLPLASSQDTYYVRPTASEATPPCEDCLTLSEYAREANTYFNSDNLTLVFLSGEHSLDTTTAFEQVESVLLVGNTTSLPHITSKIVCSQQLAALSFVNVSKVEIKALAFTSCGNGSVKTSDVKIDVDLDTLLEQPENITPAVSAVFIPAFHFTSCRMENCFLPLLLNRSTVYLQANTFEHNTGHFGGAVAAYSSTVMYLRQNAFRYNHAEFGGAVFAENSYLIFSGYATLIGNNARFGGGGVCVIDSWMSFNESPLRDLLWPYDSSVYMYMQNIASLGGGLFLMNSTVVLVEATLEFTANHADNGGGIYSNLSSAMLEGRVLFKYNSAGSTVLQKSGLGFGGAALLHFSDWTTTAVTFIGNTAADGGGAVYTQSSHMNFTGITPKLSVETDFPLYETYSHTCLVNNSAEKDGGGLLARNSIIEFDGDTLLEYNSAGFVGGGGISAQSFSKLSFKCNTTFFQNSAEEGGGLSATLTEVTFEGLVRFTGNLALRGGGFEAQNSSVTISGETSFTGNHALVSGGGLYLLNTSLTATGIGTFFNNTANYSGGAATCTDNCSLILEGEYDFSGNEARHGGAISVHSGHVRVSGKSFLVQNSAIYGGAISVNEGHTTVSGETFLVENNAVYGGAIAMNEGHATIYGKTFLVQNEAVYGGAIFSKESKGIVLVGQNSFVSNSAKFIGYGGYGGGIHAVRTKIIISGVVNFTNNMAVYGGGLSVADYDSDHFILLSHQSNILFFSNFAQSHGGALLIEDAPNGYCVSDSSDTTTAGSCFFKFLDVKPASFTRFVKIDTILRNVELHIYVQKCTISTTFEGNFAQEGGDAIYGGALHICRVVIPLRYMHQACDEELKGDIHPYVTGLEAVSALANMPVEQMIANPRNIASDPFKVCVCHNTKPDCTQRAITQTVCPGETVPLPVVSVGQANGVVPGVIHAKVIGSEEAWVDKLQSTQSVNMTCTALRYTLLSHGIGSAELFLSAEGPCGEAGVPLIVSLSFLSCPVGFALSQFGSCQCGQRLQKYTNSCDINIRTITRSTDFWLGVDYQSHDLILHPHCPFDYCKLQTVSFTLNSTDLQCVGGRSGILCGSCKSGFSLNLGSSQCSPCSNAFIPLFIVFAIAGFLLVMFLFTCKVTVSAGTTGGLIFYANILAVNQSVFFPSGETNILTVFIAWLNLDLGIETCLFNGMDMYTWTWLQFVFPFYIWLLVCATTVVSYYSTKVAKLIGPTNPVSVLSTLFLLSYTKLIRTIIAIFSFTTLDYPNDRRVTVWVYDGNIGYLKGKHIPLFLAGLLAFLFLFLPYTLLLLFGQCIVAASNYKLLSWASNLKLRSFLDAHHAPYKNNHRYWTGLLLLIRFLLFIISAVISINSPRDSSVNLLLLAITCAGILTWTLNTGSMYRRWYNNALESAFILNLAILAAASYQVKVEGGSQAAVVYASTSAAFLTFIVIMVYHASERMKSSQVWRRYVKAKLRLCLETFSHWHHAHQEPIEVSVPPTAPQRPVPTTFVELRESLLESQH